MPLIFFFNWKDLLFYAYVMSTFNSQVLTTIKSKEDLEFHFIYKFYFSEIFLQQVFLHKTEIN